MGRRYRCSLGRPRERVSGRNQPSVYRRYPPVASGAVAHFYPRSTYADGLDGEVKERAARQIFLPPMSHARVICPHCGAPNPNVGQMEEIIAFVCAQCGAGVQVEPPKPQ